MQLSACNQLKGTVKEIKQGKICAEVQLELPGGGIITAVITSSAVAKLGLMNGAAATAVIKASNVMIAVD